MEIIIKHDESMIHKAPVYSVLLLLPSLRLVLKGSAKNRLKSGGKFSRAFVRLESNRKRALPVSLGRETCSTVPRISFVVRSRLGLIRTVHGAACARGGKKEREKERGGFSSVDGDERKG